MCRKMIYLNKKMIILPLTNIHEFTRVNVAICATVCYNISNEKPTEQTGH